MATRRTSTLPSPPSRACSACRRARLSRSSPSAARLGGSVTPSSNTPPDNSSDPGRDTWGRCHLPPEGGSYTASLNRFPWLSPSGGRSPIMQSMAGRECYHCKQWVEEGEAHDCWTTTESALTRELSDDLLDAWERLRDTAVSLGEQRIYASHKSIMFSRKSCYFFVRPKRESLEVCIFLEPRPEVSARAAGRSSFEVKGRELHPDPPPRRGRSPNHRLAAGGLPAAGHPHRDAAAIAPGVQTARAPE